MTCTMSVRFVDTILGLTLTLAMPGMETRAHTDYSDRRAVYLSDVEPGGRRARQVRGLQQSATEGGTAVDAVISLDNAAEGEMILQGAARALVSS